MKKPLAIVISSAAHDPAHAALSLATTSAVLRRTVAIHLHAEAVRIADPQMEWTEDQAFAASGLPTLRDLLDSALELGVSVNACQSGLALTGLAASQLAKGVETGGLIDFLARVTDAEIILS